MERLICIGIAFNAIFVQAISALTCEPGKNPCGSIYDSCCSRFDENGRTSVCCRSTPSEWIVKTSGIGIGLTIIVLFVVIFCSCKQRIRRLTGIRQLPSEPDLPPSYETLKKVSEPEPPSYFKLFPIPMTSRDTSNNNLPVSTDSPPQVVENEPPYLEVTSQQNNGSDVASTSVTISSDAESTSGKTPGDVTVCDVTSTSQQNEREVMQPKETSSDEAENIQNSEKFGHDNLAITLEPN